VNRSEKEALVQEMAERLGRARAVILTDFRGLKVEKMTELRAQLKEKGLDYKVVKNTLLRRATEGTSSAVLADGLEGPNGVAISYEDPVELAKVLKDFAKINDKLVLKGGMVEGKAIGADQIDALAKLPAKEQLLAMLLGTMNGVPRGFVTVLAQVIRGLLNALKAIEEQKAENAA